MATYETLVDNARLPRETAALLRTASAMAGQPTREDSDVRQDIPAIRTSLWFWWGVLVLRRTSRQTT